jgi:AGCS family alanine or glycine:cation symporter
VVIIGNIGSIGKVIGSIFQYAFLAPGRHRRRGGRGYQDVHHTWGVKRGVFSNEAGLGSAPIAHAASSEDRPRQAGPLRHF